MQVIIEQAGVKPSPAPPAVPTPAASLPTGGRIPDGPDPDWDALFAFQSARRCGEESDYNRPQHEGRDDDAEG